MMNSNKIFTSVLTISALAISLAACEKSQDTAEKGPAEKVGQQLDQAAAQAAVQINKAAEQAGKGLAKAGETIQGAAKNAQTQDEKK
ncbi:MAG: hypothetical protein JWQ21_2812 [Herminiimonas sp.]|nr:hypothetical protein [Herminiimonas sp.]